MSTPYESQGRSAQKSRTRQALIAATRVLVASGNAPTVERAAREAGVSRTTAYRYFPNQDQLLLAAHPETAATSLLPPAPPEDCAARLDIVAGRFIELIIDTEAAQRTMLRLSLDPNPSSRGQLPLRQGRAITWIREALEPLDGRLTEPELHALVLSIRSSIGIEALVWLTDVGGLTRNAAARSMRWSAQALLAAALAEAPPGDPRH